jgi:hypothetical protein
MNKKGQGMPLNTIIIAIIVIVVLVVIILIFTGQINIFQRSANACLARGGFCSVDACPGAMIDAGHSYCANLQDGRQYCCRGLPGGNTESCGANEFWCAPMNRCIQNGLECS